MRYEEFMKYINDLLTTSSRAKGVIFKNIIIGSELDERELKAYLRFINNLVDRVSEEFKSSVDKMGKVKELQIDMCVPYDNAKEYLYCNYDYASALKFIDGLIRLINEGKVEKNDDVTEFFNHTVSLAFKDRSTTVGGMIEEARSIFKYDNKVSVTLAEITKYNSVKGQRLINTRDADEIKTTIKKVVEYMTKDLDTNRDVRTKDMRLLTSMINSIIEYNTYTVAAYVSRVFVVEGYICQSYSKAVWAESCDCMNLKFSTSIDEIDARDITKFSLFKEKITEFDQFNGMDTFLSSLPDGGYVNALKGTISTNELCSFILNIMPELEYCEYQRFCDINDSLQEFNNVTNPAVFTSAKQSFINIVKDAGKELKTKDEFRRLLFDVSNTAIDLLKILSEARNNVANRGFVQKENETHFRPDNGRSTFIDASLPVYSEISKSITALYKDIALLFYTKICDIDMRLNTIDEEQADELKDMLAIKVPGGDESDYSSEDNMKKGAPYSEGFDDELIAIYGASTSDYLQLYDEYAKSILGDDQYYTEAAEFINKIIAWIQGIINSLQNKYRSAELKKVETWVKNNQAELSNINTNGQSLAVFRYKALKIDYVDKLIASMKSGVSANVIKNKEEYDKLLDSFYNVTPELHYIFKEFNGNEKEKKGKFENYIIFNIDPKSTTKPMTTQLINQDILNEMKNVWIPTVSNAVETGENIINTMNEVKTFLNSLPQTLAITTQASAVSEPPAMGNDEEKKDANDTSVKPETVTTDLQNILNQLVMNLESVIFRAIKTQYGYIQAVWKMKK